MLAHRQQLVSWLIGTLGENRASTTTQMLALNKSSELTVDKISHNIKQIERGDFYHNHMLLKYKISILLYSANL